jgi:hypothetical protein
MHMPRAEVTNLRHKGVPRAEVTNLRHKAS